MPKKENTGKTIRADVGSKSDRLYQRSEADCFRFGSAPNASDRGTQRYASFARNVN